MLDKSNSRSRPVMLWSQVEMLCGGFNDWLCKYLPYWYLISHLCLDFEYDCGQLLSLKFSAGWFEHQYFLIETCCCLWTTIKTNIWCPLRLLSIFDKPVHGNNQEGSWKVEMCPSLLHAASLAYGVIQHQKQLWMVYWLPQVTHTKPNSVVSWV